MSDAQNNASVDQMWRGIDFSGLTVVLGAGTGRLIELLADQKRLAQGHLAVLSFQPASLKALREGLDPANPVLLMQGRTRQLPFGQETVDLLVVNGVLREVPAPLYGRFFEELWRVMVQGGQLRISDIIEPTDDPQTRAWAQRNALIRALGEALEQPTAISVDVKQAAMALRATGFEDLSLSLLPGYGLTEQWLEETTQAIGTMLSRVVDVEARATIARGLEDLARAYQRGNQRAAGRLVLSGHKVGELALDMRSSFTEDDLLPSD